MHPTENDNSELRRRRAGTHAQVPQPQRHETRSVFPLPVIVGFFCISLLVVSLYFGLPEVPLLTRELGHKSSVIRNMASETHPHHVVIIGGGLAGLSAACKAIDEGAFVTLVEKEVLGGNSAKATSGINGVHTRYQNELIAQGVINDTVELFEQDTMKAGHNKNKVEVVEALAKLSGEAVDSLETEFGMILSDVQQLGGHSARRTHRFPAKDGRVAPVGFTLVSTIKKKFLEHVEAKKAELYQKTALIDFELSQAEDQVTRITSLTLKDLNDQTERTVTDFSAVIISAGGYSADSSAGSVLAQNRPDLIGFPTTNGEFASGDMIRIGERHGLATIHLEHVQLHPTGFVDPKDPHANRKFLCPEVMRGLGAILVDTEGRRFVDELLPRDKVSEFILNKGGDTKAWKLSDKSDFQRIALMVMSQQTAERFGMAAYNFYMSKGFIFDISDADSLRKYAPTVDSTILQDTITQYDMACDGAIDDCCGKTVFPQKFNLAAEEKLFGAFITPSLHYSMGGLEIDANSHAILKDSREIVPNLFIAGESSGGVHGGNRLGGNGCLESLVFGRLSGRLAAAL
eukprot:Gregarina_sp_Poly_1__1645@NODE_141_length_12988_cov_478_019271_g126_i0_p3_GENE_NODE_141_length_12988_cov_478_019271_g126_i0NODE_141_length_12988_cov_478_019271_g126_i0_p3_ORF_typecomplete_len573_score82_76FAD_binding_2/PF00890_24/4_3e75DAO/PF01266_24/4_3e12FAD_oxidored/PF12831_7/3_7e08HI0933_like/PF03486_14/1e05HI0933_like/PF03486_14/2_5e03Pyr_redox_2/PF07992_14/5e06GIDA/PF01134_22/7_7e06GIDA/PF01134_22/6_2e02Pyr_redox/PF00070_27/6_8e06Pyr_redox/PF00070_27/4e03Thi4/PF01946_17/1_7e05Thi4/PF01946_